MRTQLFNSLVVRTHFNAVFYNRLKSFILYPDSNERVLACHICVAERRLRKNTTKKKTLNIKSRATC